MFIASEIARCQHGAHLGPTGPRWAPCWPHELCYLGWHSVHSMNYAYYWCLSRIIWEVVLGWIAQLFLKNIHLSCYLPCYFIFEIHKIFSDKFVHSLNLFVFNCDHKSVKKLWYLPESCLLPFGFSLFIISFMVTWPLFWCWWHCLIAREATRKEKSYTYANSC